MNSTDSKITLRHRARLLANKLLAPAGIALARTKKSGWFEDETRVIKTRIGNYWIDIPARNPLSLHYATHPEFSTQLSNLVMVLRQKFPRLAAMDIGANVGDTACVMKTVAADIPLICVEGDEFTFGFLEKNLTQFKDSSAHKLFLGEKTAQIRASFEKAGWNSTIKPAATDAAGTLSITSLDDFLSGRPGLENLRLFKIDTEGFDCPIIRGARSFLQKNSPVITFEYNRENMEAIGEKGLDTLSMLAGLGYSDVAFHDPHGRLVCTTTLENRPLIEDLHNYVDGHNSDIHYFDVTVFHRTDLDVAETFIQTERNKLSKTGVHLRA